MVTKRLYLYGAHDWAMVLTFLLYIHTALVFSVINVAWIDLIHELGISYTSVGLISVIGAGFSMLSMLLGGSIVGRFGARQTLIMTVPILVISHASLALAPSQLILFAVNVGWGVGFGAMLVACTTIIIDWERERRKRIIDPFQASWNIASIAGALLGGYLLSIGWTFISVMWLASLTSIPIWILIVFAKFPGSGVVEESSHPFEALRIIGQYRELALLGFMIVGVTFSQNVGQTWSPIYLDTLGANPFVSGAALAGFQSATALFRLINGLLVTRYGARTVLMVAAITMIGAASMLILSRDQYVVFAAFILLGGAVAGATPTAITLGVQLAPNRTAAVSAGILTLGEVGFTISTPVLGWLGDAFSLQWALATALPCGILMFVAVLFLPHKIVAPTTS
ncbi:MAG: MFS transporter [Chloroflexia bacterium]|nr:MFS transporter [Chloroflexia bacterium]